MIGVQTPEIDRESERNHYGCVMPSITIKGLPRNVHQALKTRAVLNKRSLNQEVLSLLEQSVAMPEPVSAEELIAESRRFRAKWGFKTTMAEINAFKREGRP